MSVISRIQIRNVRRPGAAVPLVAVSSVLFVGMAALTVDVGMMYRARTELQAGADAAALAGAAQLLDNDRLKGAPNMIQENSAARAGAIAIAAANKVMGQAPLVDGNNGNTATGDVVIGYLNNPNDRTEAISFSQTDRYNSVLVRVRRNQIRNGPIDLIFANIFGIRSANLGAEATAVFKDGAIGFKVTQKTGNAGILPLALQVDVWKKFLAGQISNGDHYAYHDADKTLGAGSDGIPELNLYPGSGTGEQQVTPGNFGTVDIGSSNNSTADLSRQIRYGLSPADLAVFGGELKLGPNGTLILNGDTGLSAAIKDDLTAIKGLPRVIPLFSQVSGPGNNSMFTIVGFAGIRIVNVKLTGAMSGKNVLIQPAFVVDDTVITRPGSGTSSFIYEPVRLAR